MGCREGGGQPAEARPVLRGDAGLLRGDADYREIYDDTHDDEDRFLAVGPVRRGVIVVVYTERQEDVVRIISARIATKGETELFRGHRDSHHE